MKTILFDLDGTLIDSTEAILESFYVSFEQNNLKKPSSGQIKKLIGYPLEIMYERLGIKKELCDEYVQDYKKYYRRISQQKTKLLPDAKEAIVEASKIANIGVVTTKTSKMSKILLDGFGVLNYFDVVVGREDVQNPKPHEEPILRALELMGQKPSMDVYMVGDTVLDLKSAKNAKVNSIGLTCGYGDGDDLKKYTPHIAQNALKAVRLLKT